MHSFLKAIGFSQISKREEMKKIILDVIKNYDKKNVIQDYPDGTFAEFSRNYGNDCGITVCGQYDDKTGFMWSIIIRSFMGQELRHRRQLP